LALSDLGQLFGAVDRLNADRLGPDWQNRFGPVLGVADVVS
jgi:hypothetical protein